MLPLRFGVKAWRMASLRAILASPDAACWMRVFVEFEIAYSMQSFRLITFEDSWAQELSTGPRVITKYTQIKAIKRVFLLITIALLHFRHKASTFTVPFKLNRI